MEGGGGLSERPAVHLHKKPQGEKKLLQRNAQDAGGAKQLNK